MSLRRLLLGDPRCARCTRLVRACICGNVDRGHAKAAKRAKVEHRPRPCPNGCGRTMRGGVCPGPDC